MRSRLEFREYLKTVTGVEHLYFQPPEDIKMEYPAIVYEIDDTDNSFANNKAYKQYMAYSVTVIDSDPDSEIFHKLLGLPLTQFDRQYKSDNLNHFVFTIYF